MVCDRYPANNSKCPANISKLASEILLIFIEKKKKQQQKKQNPEGTNQWKKEKNDILKFKKYISKAKTIIY